MSYNTSAKLTRIKDLALTTGSTVNIGTGEYDVTAPGASYEDFLVYRVTGTQTLVSNFAISPSGTAYKNIKVEIHWEAACTPSGNTVTIFGQTVPDELLSSDFIAVCTYNGSAWKVVLLADWAATSIVNTSRLEDDAVTEAKLADDAVSTDKIVDDAVTIDKIADAAVDTAQLVDGAVETAKIADANVTTAKIADSNVTTAKIADSNVTTAKVADAAITKAKIAKPQRLYSKYSDTGTSASTSEETLATYTVTAGYVANDGEAIRITASGTFASNVHTKTLKVKFGSNTYVTNAVTTAPNGLSWSAVVTIFRSGSTSAIGSGYILVDGEPAENVNIQKGGITWANANDVLVTGQNGTATANDIVCSTVLVEHIA